jgi:hypothetical protein
MPPVNGVPSLVPDLAGLVLGTLLALVERAGATAPTPQAVSPASPER